MFKFMIIIICAVCVISNGVNAFKLSKVVKNQNGLNTAVDEIVDLVLEKIKNMRNDSATLPDQVEEFQKEILNIFNVSGHATLYNGELWGLKSIERYGDAHMKIKNVDTILLKASFIFPVIKFMYEFEGNILSLQQQGIMYGNITKLIVDTDMEINIFRKEVNITGVDVVKAEVLKVMVENKDSIRYMVMNNLLRLFTSVFKNMIIKHVNTEVKKFIGTGIIIDGSKTATE